MGSQFLLGQTIQNARRAQEIISVLVSYGFEDVMQDLGLDRMLNKGKRLLGMGKPDSEMRHEPQAVRLRHVLEALGPTFIKLGQILSTRPDLIPVEWADEFRKLQDDVPAVAFEKIRDALNNELANKVDELFESIERKPLAAASMAQVHRAKLKSGEEIVLKVLRPGIREVIDSDIHIMQLLADFAEDHFSNLGYSPREVVNQFAREIRREADLLREGRATDRFRDDFADNEFVHFPRVYWEATTNSVLALEEIKGTPLSRITKDQFTQEELTQIVAHGVDAVFRQCFQIGFFHADPHPGNIFVLPGNKICFLDCGMTGHIDPASQQQLAELVKSVIEQDLGKTIEAVVALADADPNIVHNRSFRADTWEFIARFEGASFERLDMGNLLQDFFVNIRKHKLRCPADLVYLIKAITTIEGVGESLVPEYDLVGHVRPYIERLVRQRYGIGALRRRFREGVAAYTRLVEELPGQIQSLLTDVRRNRVTVNLEHRGLDKITNTIEHASKNIAFSMFFASLVLGASILILADTADGDNGWLTIAAVIIYAGTGVTAFIRLIANRLR